MRNSHPMRFLLRGLLALLAAGSMLVASGVQGAGAEEEAWPAGDAPASAEAEGADSDVVAVRDGVEIRDPGRHIEDIIVTAERRESSVQDTSIAITAFTGEFLDDFGIRNQEDLQNFIPATTIQPYDATIRGVGRNFRALGGDPGVATYMNGIYSEDLLTATAATLWDVQRVEVLRGPQGTLYGRNAVGGAINILYREPSDEFEAAFRSIYGNFGTQEYYGVVSGPLGSDKLSGRVNFSLRERDGVVDDIGWGSDLDGLGTKNIALQLKFEPTDDIKINIRQNIMRIDRSFGGANGGGLVVLNEEGGDTRVTDALVPGYRAIDPAKTGVVGDPGFFDNDFTVAGQPIFTFSEPITGNPVQAQRVRPGIDYGDFDGAQNAARSLSGFNNTTGAEADRYNNCVFPGDISGDQLCAATNALNREQFNQEGTQLSFAWNVSDQVELRYLFGYNRLDYQRTTDDDNTASRVHDRQFYVNHEAAYSSHEVQAFVDVTDTFSFTTGIFFYDAIIDQRGDFYSSVDEARMRDPYVDTTALPQYVADAIGAPGAGGLPASLLAFGGAPMATLYTAKNNCLTNGGPYCGRNSGLSAPDADRNASINLYTSAWYGDDGSDPALSVYHGPSTSATDLLYATQTQRDAFAAYFQSVWDFSEKFSLTTGVRSARDKVTAEENLFRYSETGGRSGFPNLAGDVVDPAFLFLYGDDPFGVLGITDPRSGLQVVNATNGGFAVDSGTGVVDYGTPTQKVTNGGIPFALSVYRPFQRNDDKITFRVNLDWDINEFAMMYFSTTSGYRSGGYNLVFFSNTATYDPEELMAYEIGYKTLFLDETLRINGSFYLYDYDNIHTVATEVSAIGGTTTSVLAAPGARIWGIEADFIWLTTDYLTLGGNFSYTPSEYTADLFIKDSTSPDTPGSLFPEDDIRYAGFNIQNINGNQLLQVPEWKATVWASYLWPLNGGSDLEFYGVYAWIDEVFYSPFESQSEKADSYGRLDMRATWRSPNQTWGITFFANNLMDDIGVLQVLREGEDEFFRHTGGTTVPRHFGVEFTVSLGGYGW